MDGIFNMIVTPAYKIGDMVNYLAYLSDSGKEILSSGIVIDMEEKMDNKASHGALSILYTIRNGITGSLYYRFQSQIEPSNYQKFMNKYM